MILPKLENLKCPWSQALKHQGNGSALEIHADDGL